MRQAMMRPSGRNKPAQAVQLVKEKREKFRGAGYGSRSQHAKLACRGGWLRKAVGGTLQIGAPFAKETLQPADGVVTFQREDQDWARSRADLEAQRFEPRPSVNRVR